MVFFKHHILQIATLLLFIAGCSIRQPSKFVNPLIGTDGTGHTFPGPCAPFGLVQPGPDNANKGWDYTSGYQFQDSVILGFSQTRCNGTGINEFGDVLLQPITDSRTSHFEQTYQKKNGKSEIGVLCCTIRK